MVRLIALKPVKTHSVYFETRSDLLPVLKGKSFRVRATFPASAGFSPVLHLRRVIPTPYNARLKNMFPFLLV